MSGLKLAALYSWKPQELGFCGPKDDGTLLKYLKGGNVSEKKVREILGQFEGAHPYYKDIAKKKNIKDVFDEKIVRAYWITHHIHHVLTIGSVNSKIVIKGKLLDLCRVCWGRVKKIKNKNLEVEYQPLVGNRLGKSIEKEIDWDKDLVPDVKIGDWVSFHWNQVVEVLTKKDIKNLEKYTKNSIDLYNKK